VFFWQDLYDFPRPTSQALRDSTRAVQFNWILLSKGYFFSVPCHLLVDEAMTSYEPFFWKILKQGISIRSYTLPVLEFIHVPDI